MTSVVMTILVSVIPILFGCMYVIGSMRDMVKISRVIKLELSDIDGIVDTGLGSQEIFLKHKLDYPVNVMYEIHMPTGDKCEGYLTNNGLRIVVSEKF